MKQINKVSPIAGLQFLLEYHMLVLFGKLNFLFEFETVNQLEFEPRSLGLKAAKLTIELHSIDTLPYFLQNGLKDYF